jgi:hypothetical protein
VTLLGPAAAAQANLTIPYPSEIQDGTIYHTDGNGHTLNSPIHAVNPITLLAWGGSPHPGYTWTLANLSAFPPGTTVDSLTGIFHRNGSPLISGTYSFTMTVSDGSTTANGTFSFAVKDDYVSPPAVTPFEQLNQSIFKLPDAKVGTGYGASLYADGGTPPYKSWSLASGALPPGLAIDMASGVV